MLDTTPTQPGFLYVSFGSPSCSLHRLRFTHSPVSEFSPSCLTIVIPYLCTGVRWASQVLVCISSYMPRLENSAGPLHPRLYRMLLCCLRRALQPSATETSSFRSDTSTSGSAVSPAACMILCVRFACFVRPGPPGTPPQTQHSIRVGG
jgi:hypothetical protein